MYLNTVLAKMGALIGMEITAAEELLRYSGIDLHPSERSFIIFHSHDGTAIHK
jgi:hypothetical protein